MMADSQAVKNTCTASLESKGFCFYKATNGIKRHLVVDSLGFPYFTACTPANVSDDAALIALLLTKLDYFKSKPMNVPMITVLLDNGYNPERIKTALKQVYPDIGKKLRFELSPKPSKAEKTAQGKTGFVPVATRWVIERSNAWMERCKSLTKNFDRTLTNAKARIDLCFTRLLLKRLAMHSEDLK